MKLKNKQLIDLDKRIHELNKTYGMIFYSINNVPNLFAINKIIRLINSLKKDLETVKSEDEFEKIFTKNHLLNLENQRAYLRYYSLKDAEKTDNLLKMFFGKDALEKIHTKLKNFDYKADWEFYLSYQEYTYRSYPADSPEFQEEFKELLAELKKDIIEYAREYYGLERDYDFDLILGQPYSQRSFFSPSTKRVEIAPSNFFVYKEGKSININVTLAIQTIFHEFIGHALQGFNSEKLPASLRDDSINLSVPTTNLHAEGYAQMMDEFAIKFMREFAEKYKIKEEYIKQRENYLRRRDLQLFWNYYQYLRLKNLENPFNYKEDFLKHANNFGALINFEHSEEKPFSFFKNISYVFGLEKVKEIHKKLLREFGQEKEAVINKALSTGLLNIEVIHDFGRYFIKNFNNLNFS
jgi:hypothetical protein